MKRMCIILIFVLAVGFSATAFTETINIEVSGLVCDFCARAAERTFTRSGKIENIDIDLDSGNIVVVTKPGADLTDEEVVKMMMDSGYNVISITRE